MDYATLKPASTATYHAGPSSPPLPARILLKLARTQEQPAIHYRDATVCNGQLLAKVCSLREQLAAAGIGRGSVVACMLQRSPDVLVALLAIWSCEAVYLPLDAEWPQARLLQVLDQCSPDCLLAHSSLQDRACRLPCRLLTLQPINFSEPVTAIPDPLELPDTEARDCAYLLFTSGSTGMPKGVVITHEGLATLLDGVIPLLVTDSGKRFLGSSSLYFDIVFFELLAPLLTSGELVLADQQQYRDPAALLELILSRRIDIVQATPALWQLLLQALQELPLQSSADASLQAEQENRRQDTAGQQPNLKLHAAISTGEALHAETARRILPHCRHCWNLYGPTECTVWASAYRISEASLKEFTGYLPIGSALPGYSLRLHNNDQLIERHGELLISGPAVSPGYLDSTGGHAEKFTRQGNICTYHSGDLCFLDDRDVLHFIRRMDRQLKVNGYRIEAGEIELRLQQHHSIQQAVCLVRQVAENNSDQLVAAIVARPGTPNKDKSRLNQWLSQWLPEWMLPHRYLLLESIPLNASGKTDFSALHALLHPGTNKSQDAELQHRVSSIFCNILGLGEIGLYDSFFDHGGNSMLSAVLLMKINEEFDSSLKLKQLLDTPPTVASVCRLLQHCCPAAAATP